MKTPEKSRMEASSEQSSKSRPDGLKPESIKSRSEGLKPESIKSRSKLKFLLIPLGVFALVSIYITLVTERQRTYTYRFNDYSDIVIPVDQEAIDHGRHLFVTRGCVDCHDMDAGGSVIRDGWFSGTIVAPNLTRGEGGIGGLRTSSELIRAFREGVRHDSTSVLFMPAHKFASLNEADVSAIVAYVRNAEPVDRELPETHISLPVRFAYMLAHRIELFPARNLRHPLEISKEIPVSDQEKGKYLASACVGCHGYALQGGKIPGVPPTWPAAPSLRQNGALSEWNFEEFATAMREGQTPDGRHLDEDYMPWTAFGKLSDEEMELIWEYLKSLE